ncbi:uncharacterized protein A4U43_C01F19290 [Asparagus officinalis]|uniref:Uncharacterized protein n=1 Tax=Asparagus officinalis TaxID=4686 RepID=A0A5P1FU95_ASPOF|nr:uncharacterized protein A4U43_C01F19290 [Asparagus officinalis]
MPSSGNIALLQRYKHSKWLVKYLARIRKILQSKDHYRLYCCFSLIDGLMRFFHTSKEPIPLEDKKEQVDYGHDDIDAYLTEPDDASDLGDIGGSSYMPDDESDFENMGEAMPTSFPVSNHFEPVTNFEGASDVLASVPTFEMTKAPAPAPAR